MLCFRSTVSRAHLKLLTFAVLLLTVLPLPLRGQQTNLLDNPDFEASAERGQLPGWRVRGFQMGTTTPKADTDFRWTVAPGEGWRGSQALRLDNLTGAAPPSLVSAPRDLTRAAGPYRLSIRLRSLERPLRLRFFVIDEQFRVTAREHLFARAQWTEFVWEGEAEGRMLFRLDVMGPGTLLVDDAALVGGIRDQQVFVGHRRSVSPGADKISYVVDASHPGKPLPDFHGVCYLQGHSGPRLPQQINALPLRYVRNHNVLSHLGVVTRDAVTGRLTYNWDRFDATVREILAVDAVPVMSLTFVPLALVRQPDPALVRGPYYAGPPDDLKEWDAFISELVRHCADQWDVRPWYWVFGNEPDLPQFSMGTREQFYALYRATADAALRVEPKLRIGAGAFQTDKVWLRDFVARCARDRAPLRLLTWHEYGTLAADLPASVAESRAILDAAGYKETPLAVDEWNLVESDAVPYNADERGAAYLLSAVKAWADAGSGDGGGLGFHTYFISRAPAPAGGPGFGLLARDSDVVRPTYNAFRMLGMLGNGRRLPMSGPGDDEPYVDAVTTLSPDGKTVRVLLWNLHHPADRGPGREKEVSLFIRNFANGGEAALPAETLLIDKTHSNGLTDAARAALEKGPELEFTADASAPESERGHRTTFTLEANSVLLVTLSR